MLNQLSNAQEESLNILAKLILLGVAAMMIYAASSWDVTLSFSIFSVSFLLAGAAITLGALTGFMFGIPRSSQLNTSNNVDDKGKEAIHYQANTNLEQISDWLTKILVGAGLTQITVIPGSIQNVAEYASKGMGNSTSSIYAGSILIFFFVTGFLYGFLWTRLILPKAMKATDDDLKDLAVKTLGVLGAVEPQLDAAGKSSLDNLRQQTERALASLEPERNSKKNIDSLIKEYEQTRAIMPFGYERTAKMAAIVSRMRSASYNLAFKPADIIKLFKNGQEGARIAAIAFGEVKPDAALFEILQEALDKSKSAFEQYHSLKALESVLPQLEEKQKKLLIQIIGEQKTHGLIAQGQDRKVIANRILQKLGVSTIEDVKNGGTEDISTKP